jgi:hypothetical protein
MQLEHANSKLPHELARARVAPSQLGPPTRACEQPLEGVCAIEVAEELLEQKPLGVTRLADLVTWGRCRGQIYIYTGPW